MRTIITLLILTVASLWGVSVEQTDIETLLNNLQPQPQEELCRGIVRTDAEYLQCLEEKTEADPTIENVNFLAGVYAVKKQYDKAIQTYGINVAKGDQKATYYLAGIYNEVLKQHDRAKTYFGKIKEYKDSTCQIGGILAIVKDESWFGWRNEALAKKRTFAFYDDEIKNGNVKAYGCKGLYYNKFEAYGKAEKSFLEGVKYGDTQSLFYLGNLYYAFKYDIKKSIAYYERSYEAGNSVAARNLGTMYEERKQYDKAIEWYSRSAERGDREALLGLGHSLRKQGDIDLALKTYHTLGDLGDVRGYTSIGIYYKKNQEYDKAEKAFKECIDKGYGDCASGLGVMYENDLKDFKQAVQWYRKGYELGSAASTYNLGYFYKNTTKDYDKAIEWYVNAYEMGEIDAAFNLAVLYEKELKDKKNAILWYRKAYDMGDTEAKRKLENLGAL
jgi:TPR repeat protein